MSGTIYQAGSSASVQDPRPGKRFDWFAMLNTCIPIVAAFICVLPLIHIVAVSFSSSALRQQAT